MGTTPAPADVNPAASVESASSASQAPQQAGAANVAAQVNAAGWKGIDYQSTLPAGMALLLAWQSWLSHRREMARLTLGPTSASEFKRKLIKAFE